MNAAITRYSACHSAAARIFALILSLAICAALWTPARAAVETWSVAAGIPTGGAVLQPDHLTADQAWWAVVPSCDGAGWSLGSGLASTACGVRESAGAPRGASDEEAVVVSAGDLHPARAPQASASQSEIAWGLIKFDAVNGQDWIDDFAAGWADAAALPDGRSTAARAMPGVAVPSATHYWAWFATAVHAELLLLGALLSVWVCVRMPGWAMAVSRATGHWVDAWALGVRCLKTVEEIDPDATLSPIAVLRRGWSPELMVQLLGRPDYAVVDPQGLREPIILLSRHRVEMLEQTEKFRRYRDSETQRERSTDMKINKWVALRNAPGVWPSAV